MKKILTVIVVFAFTNLNFSFAAIYKWTDSKGEIKFSDVPPSSKEAGNIEELNINVNNKFKRNQYLSL